MRFSTNPLQIVCCTSCQWCREDVSCEKDVKLPNKYLTEKRKGRHHRPMESRSPRASEVLRRVLCGQESAEKSRERRMTSRDKGRGKINGFGTDSGSKRNARTPTPGKMVRLRLQFSVTGKILQCSAADSGSGEYTGSGSGSGSAGLRVPVAECLQSCRIKLYKGVEC